MAFVEFKTKGRQWVYCLMTQKHCWN